MNLVDKNNRTNDLDKRFRGCLSVFGGGGIVPRVVMAPPSRLIAANESAIAAWLLHPKYGRVRLVEAQSYLPLDAIRWRTMIKQRVDDYERLRFHG